MISQGTVSVLIGCHSPMHSYLVARAWRQIYGEWPKPWELCCILLHDVGHIGKQYLDDPRAKAEHWRLGAEIAGVLFGWKGFLLCAGHCNNPPFKRSDLYKPDKVSWSLAPTWWMVANAVVEPGLRSGRGVFDHVARFKVWVRTNLEREEMKDTHCAVGELAPR